jgi:hypothetical protein
MMVRLGQYAYLGYELHCTLALSTQCAYVHATHGVGKWMDGWMYYTGLSRQSTRRKAQYDAKAGGMNHDADTSHCTMRWEVGGRL